MSLQICYRCPSVTHERKYENGEINSVAGHEHGSNCDQDPQYDMQPFSLLRQRPVKQITYQAVMK